MGGGSRENAGGGLGRGNGRGWMMGLDKWKFRGGTPTRLCLRGKI